MSQETVSFTLEAGKREALDAVATALGRDRSYVLNQAVDAYLEDQRWQIEHIIEGIRQADAGEFASEAEVKAAFARWRQ
ncbi:MAG TPA: hypothetical protein VEU96_29680 [Bryobacteraceae bacterium]|nr:hypothetical protein [Bryobacteraceae bacterium]